MASSRTPALPMRLRVMVGVREAQDRINALVLNAEMFDSATIDEETPEHFDHHYSVNVRLPAMGRGASVVLIRSIASVVGQPSRGVHGATKAALRSYVRQCLRQELSG